MDGIYELKYKENILFINLRQVAMIYLTAPGSFNISGGGHTYSFSFVTYAEAEAHARAIAEAISIMNSPLATD